VHHIISILRVLKSAATNDHGGAKPLGDALAQGMDHWASLDHGPFGVAQDKIVITISFARHRYDDAMLAQLSLVIDGTILQASLRSLHRFDCCHGRCGGSAPQAGSV
jgi:hypothetical protein